MSTRERFHELMHGFCDAVLIPLEDRQFKNGMCHIRVDETQVIFSYRAELAADVLFVFANFGPPQAGHETEVFRILMQSNLLLHGTFANSGLIPSYCMSLDGNDVLYTHPVRLSETSPAQLLELVSQASDLASVWRNTDGYIDGMEKNACLIEKIAAATDSTAAHLRRH